jgi:hypothetical protein
MHLLRAASSLVVVVLMACGDSQPGPDESAPAQITPARTAFDGGPAGGGCEYTSTAGTATITAIQTPGAEENPCPNDGRVVRFTFTPDDPATPPLPASLEMYDKGVSRLVILDGKAPPSSCLPGLGIKVGATIRATRKIQTKGTCSPVVFVVDVDLTSCAAQCGG